MKKIALFIICALIGTAVSAQNVKPYQIDLSKVPSVNDDKTVTFDKATKTVTVKKDYPEQAGVQLRLGQDISSYNILRIKYKVSGYVGFYLFMEYENDNLDDYENPWMDRNTYCPPYLTEVIIPLKKGMKKLNVIGLYSTNGGSEQKFVIENITLEKIENPVKTDLYFNNEPAVIDTAVNTTIDGTIDAWDFVKQLGAGLQYGVFEDSPKAMDFETDVYEDTALSKPKEQIKLIKQRGFKTIRLQTNPNIGHLMDKNYTINPQYIKNIKQVVDWCIEEDMYVIICGPYAEYMGLDEYKKRIEAGYISYAGYYVNENNKKESKRFIEAIWKQYAQAFNNSYDEHLIFETFNEPVDVLHEHGWLPQENCAVCKKDFTILNEYNQLIVDTIRSTGGNNANRFILIEGLGFARWQYITSKFFKLPKDKAKNKLIPTYHHYPMSGADRNYYTEGMKAQIKEAFVALDKTYFSKHIPVYVGEVGHHKSAPIIERINCMKDFMKEVTAPNRSCAALLHIDSDINGQWGYGNFRFSWDQNTYLKWNDNEYLDTFIYGAQGKEYTLSEDFIKKNEVKIESIVGKNLLSEPIVLKNWDSSFRMNPEIFVRSVPAKYKLEFQIEKTGSEPILQFGLDGRELGRYPDFYDISKRSDVKVTGAVKNGERDFFVKSETFTISISKELASIIESSESLCFNGQNMIIKSVKVVE
ncbi:MAG: glycoside hydrolase family 5 protein [Treponema sp.]|nr:glycoside hydrolase family 5 protein [Treponema sp.]